MKSIPYSSETAGRSFESSKKIQLCMAQNTGLPCWTFAAGSLKYSLVATKLLAEGESVHGLPNDRKIH
jgi:hypothetical protein